MGYSHGISFREFCSENSIGKFNWIKGKAHYEFNFDEISSLVKIATVKMGHEGGLVFGNLHSQGGIQLLQPISETSFRHVGEMEGWEYITSAKVYANHQLSFKKINNSIKMTNPNVDTSFEVPNSCKIIDLSGQNHQVIILSGHHHYVINRIATKNNINTIINLDNS